MAVSDFFKIDEYKNQINYLQKENESLKEKNKALNNEIDRLNYIANNKSSTIAEQLGTLRSRFPLTDFEKLKVPLYTEPLQKVWNSWDSKIHSQAAQIDRQERACSDVLTPLDINASNGSGHFRGKEVDYFTNLNYCECMDYQRRLLPCKHMYRLAHEMDVFTLDHVAYRTDIHRLFHLSDAKRKLQQLSQSQKDLLLSMIDNDAEVCSPSDLRPLIELGFAQISSNKYELLNQFKKEDLINLIPEENRSTIKKSIKKSDLINLIITDFPDLISPIEKLSIVGELSPNFSPIASQLSHLL